MNYHSVAESFQFVADFLGKMQFYVKNGLLCLLARLGV